MVASNLKKLTQLILFILTFLLWSSFTHAMIDGEDYNHKFASTPFEYTSLPSPLIKNNLIFLVDNSTFAVPIEAQAIITAIISDPYMYDNFRAGIAYLYANSHPFVTEEIPLAFLVCAITEASVVVPEIAATIATIGAVAIALPTILGILSTQTAAIAPTCLPLIEGTAAIPNITLNSHMLATEVRLNDLNKNSLEIFASLAAITANNVVAPGLPSITRRYYEITREIRGLTSNNSFLERPSTDNPYSNALLDVIDIKNILNAIPVVSLITSPILGSINSLKGLVGGLPKYQPLFDNAMQYRCQSNFIIVLSPSVVAPATLSTNGKITTTILEFTKQLGKIDQGVITALSRFIPMVDLNPLQIPEDDTLVRNYIYKKNGNNLPFARWNNPLGHYSPHGLAFLSTLFEESDIKTTSDGLDAESQSWDSKDYPFQNITTITINTGANKNKGILDLLVNGLNNIAANPTYLKNASSYSVKIGKEGYFRGLSSVADVKRVIKKALMGINVRQISNSSSTILSKLEPYQGVSAFLDTDTWSSSLRFYTLRREKNQDDFNPDLNQYITPDYNNHIIGSSRRVIVSTGDKKPEYLQGNTAFKQWLLRPSNESDSQINQRFNTKLRNRCLNKASNCTERMLGDIINAPILAIDEDPTSRNRSEDPYTTFMVTAANDGMVHIFKKTGNNKQPYSMVLDYLPAAAKRGDGTTIWKQLPNLAHAGYGRNGQHPHQYFNNGGIAYLGTMRKDCFASKESFTCQSGPRQLFIVGSYGQGGRGLYALNLGGKNYQSNSPIALSDNSQSNWLRDIPLWESGSDKYGASQNDSATKKAHQSLGYIIGTPVLANMAISRTRNNELNQMKPKNDTDIHYAVLTHNGLFSDDESPTLYVFDALGITKKEEVKNNGAKSASFTQDLSQRGKLIAKIETEKPASGLGERQGLSAPAVVDVDNDGIADVAYAGDYQGNLYRFDFRKEKPSEWKATKIYTSLDPNSKTPQQPITTAPSVYRLDGTGSKYVVMFGTGSDIFEDDLLKDNNNISIKKQAIYGIYDDLNDDSPKAVTRNDLLQQVISQKNGDLKGKSKTIVILSDHKMTPEYKGWFFDLTNGIGERIVRSGRLTGNTMFFTSRVYKSNDSNNNINYSLVNACSNHITAKSDGYLIGLNPRNGGRLKRSIMNLNPVTDRYKKDTEFISGFKFEGVPSELSFVTLGQDGLTNRSGQFKSGWEDAGIAKVKQYDEGSLVVTSTANEYYVISVKEPNYIRVRKLNSREIF